MASSSAVEDEHLTDSDFSDEEGKEGEEQRQEELRSATPRPAYSDEELAHLVEFVQRMTILYALDHRDWKEKALDAIRRWLLEVNEPLLTIFYEGNTLTACLGFPTTPVLDMSYFVRILPNEIYTVDGFHDEVAFGTMHDDPDGCLLRVLEIFYSPIFRNSQDWPDNVKRRFCKGLDKFLTYLTAVHHRLAGMAVLYVPYEVQQMANEKIAFDRPFVRNLESIAVYWTTQIRTLLHDRTLTVANDYVTVADEFEFWQYRYEVLQGLNAQLAQIDVQQVIKVLRNSHSVYTKQIDELIAQAKRELEESMSNIKFLHLLIAPCAELDKAASPAVVSKLLPRIIHLIRFIWLNSERYNSRELITVLFRNLSNQIIRFCTNQTNVELILSGSSRFGITMCNMALDCCATYKGIYKAMAKQHAERDPKLGWDLDDAMIFNHIDAFMERLNDLIDICESMIVFGRLDETQEIPKPQFGGSSGAEFEKIADQVEQRFLTTLSELRGGVQKLLLNVYRDEWYEQVLSYRGTVQRLEETIQRLISNVFQHVCNVEEAIEALNVMLFYSYRGSLRKNYLRQVSQVWLLFSQEMDSTSRALLDRREQHESWLPYYTSRAIGYRINLERLSWLRNRLSSSEWLPSVPEAGKVLLRFDGLKKEFERELRLAYEDWQQSCCGGALLAHQKLDRYLLVRSKKQKGLLECNIDGSILEICEQAQQFEQLGLPVPLPLKKIYERHEELQIIYKSVLALCLSYNRIMRALSERERKLFRACIHHIDRSIAPGLFKLTYGGELNEGFMADCMAQTEQLQESVEVYKRANRAIARNCERICDTPMLQLTLTGAVSMSVFEQQLASHASRITISLRDYYDSIVELLSAVQREFEPFIEEMSAEWHRLVNVFDEMLATAFLTSARSSLTTIYAALHRDSDMAAAPILVMESDVQNRRIVLTPTMDAVAALLGGTVDRIHQILDQFPRLGHKLKLPKEQLAQPFPKVFREDEECSQLKRNIELEIANEREEMARYVDKWNGHRSVWETSDEEFTKRLKATPMTAGVFEGGIEHYSAMADDISFVEAITHVHFVLINQNAIKSSILDWIEKWQALNIKVLLDHATALITGIYRYMRRSERKVMTVPRTLKETVAAKQLFERLVGEVAIKQANFSPMLELFVLLDKYRVAMAEETRQQVVGLEAAWLKYLEKLAEADEMLDMDCEDFKSTLLLQAEKFKLILKEFYDDFYSKLPTAT